MKNIRNMKNINRVVDEIVNKHGIPKILRDLKDPKAYLKEIIISNLYHSYKEPVQWWILKFEKGKIYIRDELVFERNLKKLKKIIAKWRYFVYVISITYLYEEDRIKMERTGKKPEIFERRIEFHFRGVAFDTEEDKKLCVKLAEYILKNWVLLSDYGYLLDFALSGYKGWKVEEEKVEWDVTSITKENVVKGGPIEKIERAKLSCIVYDYDHNIVRRSKEVEKTARWWKLSKEKLLRNFEVKEVWKK